MESWVITSNYIVIFISNKYKNICNIYKILCYNTVSKKPPSKVVLHASINFHIQSYKSCFWNTRYTHVIA